MQKEHGLLSHNEIISQQETNILNALPLVRRVAEFRLRGSYRDAAEDIVQKVGLNLWRWSLKQKEFPPESEIHEESEKASTEGTTGNQEMNGEDWLRVAQVAAKREINSFYRSKYRREAILTEAALENELLVRARDSSSTNQKSQPNNSSGLEGNSHAEMASILNQVWKIILEMSLRQKYALLLQKDELIVNLITHGCCTREEIAVTLSCTKAEFDIIFTNLAIITEEDIVDLIREKIDGDITLRQMWTAREGKSKTSSCDSSLNQMMNDHLSPEEFRRLSEHNLKGTRLLAALDHLENCEDCRLKIQSPSKAELLETLFGDEGHSDEQSFSNKNSLENTQTEITDKSKTINEQGWMAKLKKFLARRLEFVSIIKMK